MQKYSVNQHLVNHILTWVQSGEVAIPEIQRPFVWKSSKVRDLMDSLYKGFPIGYLIAWKNPDVRLKDGGKSSGKKIIIDGQQRIAALQAAMLGENVVNSDYKKVRIKIAFHPIEETFETLTPAIEKDKTWISDISEYLQREGGLFDLVDTYCEQNPDVDRRVVQTNIENLFEIKNKQLGMIELAEDLPIEVVTQIFVRINQQGVRLSQADFAMSKIAAAGEKGIMLRKAVDYSAHLIREPDFYKQLNEDQEFKQTEYADAISWVKDTDDRLYQPSYSDIVRVGFMSEFNRGKLSDLVSLLSGRNFETREFEDRIAIESLEGLKNGVLNFVKKKHYERFLMILHGVGFIDKNMIRAKHAINFAYVVYLKMRDQGYEDSVIEKYVAKWFIMSLLTGRYSGGSPETQFDEDIRRINEKGIEQYLSAIEVSELSEGFWNTMLVDELNKAIISNQYLNVFWAAQVKNNDRGFLSSDITVRDMITHQGDVHHIFPKKYLQKKYPYPRDYNQIANLVFTQTEVNIKVGDKAPKDYLANVREQIESGQLKYGGISTKEELEENFKENCIPDGLFDMGIDDYREFLEQRRKLMAQKIENYYKSFNVADGQITKD
ncbi:hypothetical protein BRC19_00385 [Candidatus Saccharibacteria bacterium QS_5_54_17]|nr:MAG: hypothetical protein BRC19_00385 [Candidatus Saccharibacteria bacterium QS_5_54_17]